MRPRPSSGLVVALLAGTIAWLAPPSLAHAEPDAFRLYATVGGGLLFSSDQIGWLGFDGVGGRSSLAAGIAP